MQYAKINGEVTHISACSDYINTDSSKRPKGICLIDDCNKDIIMALGKKNTHHFRHKPDDDDDEGVDKHKHSNESVWHSDAKHHIGAILNNRQFSSAIFPSPWRCSAEGCSGHSLIPDWETETVTARIDDINFKNTRYRPDVSLMVNGEHVGMIEVMKTSETKPEKKAAFDESGLPWFEVSVQTEEEFNHLMGWTGGDDIYHLVVDCFKPVAECASCQNSRLKREAAELKRQKAKDYYLKVAKNTLLRAGNASVNIKCRADNCRTGRVYKIFPRKSPVRYELGYLLSIDGISRYLDFALLDSEGAVVAGCMLKPAGTNVEKERTIELLISEYKRSGRVLPLFASDSAPPVLMFESKRFICQKHHKEKFQRKVDDLNAQRAKIKSQITEAKNEESSLKGEAKNKTMEISLVYDGIRKSLSEGEKENWLLELARAKRELEWANNKLKEAKLNLSTLIDSCISIEGEISRISSVAA